MKKTKGGGGAFGAKKQFVLAQGEEVPAAEVVKRARKEGLKLSTAYVYVLRSEARRSGKGKAAPKGKPGPKPRAGRPAAAPEAKAGRRKGAGSGASLAALALELGLQRASELLDRLRSQVRSLD